MALTNTVDSRGMDANNRKRWSEGTLLTNNTTYATGGLDLPTKEKFGFVRSMDTLVIMGQTGAPTDQYLVQWDKASNKLQFFEEEAAAAGGPLLEEGAVALGTRIYRYVATGW